MSAMKERAGDVFARFASGVLFVLLSMNLVQDFLATRRITGLLLLVSEALVVVFTIFRRRALVVDRSAAARAVTFVSLIGPPLLRAGDEAPLFADAMTAAVSTVGLLLVIAAKMVLGRSFGLVPANRGIVCSGLYRFVRHPIYLGYLLTHIGFVAANPADWNLCILAAADVALMMRAVREERTLAQDPEYRDYLQRVRWRVVPGVF